MESRLILGGCSRNLFFQIEMCCKCGEASPVTTCGPGSAEQTCGRQNRASRVGRIQSSLLRIFLDLDRGGQVGVSVCRSVYSTIGICQVTTGLRVGLPTPRMRIYSWNQSKARFGQVGLLSRWQWPRGVMAPVRCCRWLGASCSISPREKEAVMKRALACPGKRSSSLTVSGEDLIPSKTLRPARGEGCRRGGRSGGWRPDEGRAAISEQQSGVWHGQEWAAGSGLRRDRPHQSAASIRRVGGCGWWCRD